MKNRIMFILALLIALVGFMTYDGNIDGNSITGFAGRAESAVFRFEQEEGPQIFAYKTFVKRGSSTRVQIDFGKYGVKPLAYLYKEDGTSQINYPLCSGVACYGRKNLPLKITRAYLPGIYSFEVQGLMNREPTKLEIHVV